MMNRFFFILLILFSVQAKAQDFNLKNIPFGTSMEDVYKLLEQKGVRPDNDLSSTNVLVYRDCPIYKQNANYVEFKFVRNGYHSCNIFIIPSYYSQVLDTYKEVKKEITKDFGKPSSYEKVNKPYDKSSIKSVCDAIYDRKAVFYSAWFFPVKDKTSLKMYIDDLLFIYIAFSNEIPYHKSNPENTVIHNSEILKDL